jgi:hypothetical protein
MHSLHLYFLFLFFSKTIFNRFVVASDKHTSLCKWDIISSKKIKGAFPEVSKRVEGNCNHIVYVKFGSIQLTCVNWYRYPCLPSSLNTLVEQLIREWGRPAMCVCLLIITIVILLFTSLGKSRDPVDLDPEGFPSNFGDFLPFSIISEGGCL